MHADMMLGGFLAVLFWPHLDLKAAVSYMICLSYVSEWEDWTLATGMLLAFSLFREVWKRVVQVS